MAGFNWLYENSFPGVFGIRGLTPPARQEKNRDRLNPALLRISRVQR